MHIMFSSNGRLLNLYVIHCVCWLLEWLLFEWTNVYFMLYHYAGMLDVHTVCLHRMQLGLLLEWWGMHWLPCILCQM